jgi:hypothetical protein
MVLDSIVHCDPLLETGEASPVLGTNMVDTLHRVPRENETSSFKRT